MWLSLIVCRPVPHGKDAVLPCATSSPCVLYMAHSKVAFRRVPLDLHMANTESHGEVLVSGSDRRII